MYKNSQVVCPGNLTYSKVSTMSKGIHMKKLLELFRLHYELKFSQRDIAKMLDIVKTTVHNYITLFDGSGLTWPLPEEYLDEAKLKLKLHNRLISTDIDHESGGNGSGNCDVDFAKVHHELKSHKHMTLKLLTTAHFPNTCTIKPLQDLTLLAI